MLRQEPDHKFPTPEAYDALSRPMGRARAYAGLMLADHGVLRPFFNRPTPVSDELWRSAQPTPTDLKHLKERGIKTIVNLRGPSPKAYYLLEAQACRRLGLTLVDFRIRSRDLPFVWQVEDAQKLFEMIEYPALMHCKSGADRAGLMSALYLIFRKGVPVEQALDQLSVRFGHFKHARTGILDYFLECYRNDNQKEPISLLDWTATRYDADHMTSKFSAGFWPSLLVDWILRRE